MPKEVCLGLQMCGIKILMLNAATTNRQPLAAVLTLLSAHGFVLGLSICGRVIVVSSDFLALTLKKCLLRCMVTI